MLGNRPLGRARGCRSHRLVADLDRRGEEPAGLRDGKASPPPREDARDRGGTDDGGAGAEHPAASATHGIHRQGLLFGLAGSVPNAASVRSRHVSRSRSIPSRTPAPGGTPVYVTTSLPARPVRSAASPTGDSTAESGSNASVDGS